MCLQFRKQMNLLLEIWNNGRVSVRAGGIQSLPPGLRVLDY